MPATTNGVADRYDFWTGNKALISNSNEEIAESVVTDVEISRLSGATSNIQTQINGKWTQLDSRITDDCNNAGTLNRITDVASAALNNPGSSTSYLVNIRNNSASTTYQGQMAVTAGVAPKFAIRNNYNGTWTSWKYALLDADNPDLVAIESLTGTSGFLKKTAADTWSLDTSMYLTAPDVKELYNWYAARPTDCNLAVNGNGGIRSFKATGSMTTNKPPQDDSHIIHLGWDNTGGWDSQLAIKLTTGQIQMRGQNAGVWSSWATVWDSLNLTNINQLTISDGVFSIAKTSGLQTALDGKAVLASTNYGTTFESTDPFTGTNRGTYTVNGGVRTWSGVGPFGSAFYNVVDCRHRNTWNAGATDVYGGELAWGMTNHTDRLAFRSRDASGTPGSWSEVAVLGKDVSFNTIHLASNNLANNIRVGDDAYIGDLNITNGVSLRGYNNSNVGYIQFGGSYLFGFNGSELVYNSNRVLTASDVTALRIPYYNGTSGLASINSFRLSSSGGNITELHLGSSANVQTFLSLYGNFASILNFDVGNALRFQVGATPTAFAIDALDASGTYIDTPISIGNAASAFVTFNRNIHAPYISAGSSDIGVMSGTSLVCSGTISGDLVAERLRYQSGSGAVGVVVDVSGAGGASLPTGQPTGTVLVYAGQLNPRTDTITIPSGEALWYRSQAGGSSRVVGPSSISVNRQCITVIKFANEWRVNGLLYV